MTESSLRPAWRRVGPAGALSLGVAVVTAVAFFPALRNDFVNWDDYINLVDNRSYRGLGWANLRWMFTTVLMGHYIPVTWLTFALDYLIWGMDPFGYHLTNVVLHTVNAGLVCLIAFRLLARALDASGLTLHAGAVVAALVFSLHPLRVESVAWVTERRDVLSGLFFLATVLLYLEAVDRPAPRRYRWLAGSVACYILAIGSKSIVMSLPLVLVLLDVYPLQRLPPHPRRWLATEARRIWLEKVPYFLVAAVGAGLAYYAVATNAFITPLERYPWAARVGMVAFSLWFYVSRTVVPAGLSPLYELPPTVHPLQGKFLVSLVAVGLITGTLIAVRRRWPAGLAAWAYYLIVLAPVSGAIHAGHQLAHDRYSYLSCLGFALLVGGAVISVARRVTTAALRPTVARAAAIGGAAALAGLGAMTWLQTQVWRDSDTLWRTALESDPTCSICEANLAVALAKAGHFDLAKERFERVMDLRPDRVRTHFQIGLMLANLGRLEEAVGHFRQVLAAHPEDSLALSALAVTLGKLGRHAEALRLLQHAARISPSDANIQANLGAAFLELKRTSEALDHYRRAAELSPELPVARYGLARAYLALGQATEAEAELEALRRLDPVLAARVPFSSVAEPTALVR
jgi:tetratricopeptide (TPR) repeat protein